jgi:O-6-methylguanine DNA methyltransferase
MFELVIPTGEGEFTAWYSVYGLTGLLFPKKTTRLRKRPSIPKEMLHQITDWHRLTTKALEMALTGREPLEPPPLDVVTGTDFQRKIWQAMREIPWGQTASYGDLARQVGRPRAVRAVGGACGANQIPVFIPCHRVLAAQGKLGGFSSGLHWKRKLLAAEGAIYRDNPTAKRPK